MHKTHDRRCVMFNHQILQLCIYLWTLKDRNYSLKPRIRGEKKRCSHETMTGIKGQNKRHAGKDSKPFENWAKLIMLPSKLHIAFKIAFQWTTHSTKCQRTTATNPAKHTDTTSKSMLEYKSSTWCHRQIANFHSSKHLRWRTVSKRSNVHGIDFLSLFSIFSSLLSSF